MVNPQPQSLHVIGDEDSAPEDDESLNESVGAFLREARQTTGRSVADVASSLRIRASFVQSIEDGRYEDLPGQTYAIGFIRSYADYLGLETQSLLEQFKAESSGREVDPNLEFPAPSTEGWFPTGKVVAGCAALAAGVFVGWYFVQNRDAVDVATVPTPPGFDSMIGAQAASAPPADEEIRNAGVAAVEPAAPMETPVRAPMETPVSTPTVADSTAPSDATADTPPAPAEEATLVEAGPSDMEPIQVAAVPATPEPAATEPEPRQAAAQADQTEAAAAAEPPAQAIDSATEVPEPPAVDVAELTPVAPAIAEAPPQPVEKPAVIVSPVPAAAEPVTQVASLPSIPAAERAADNGHDGRIYGVTNQESRVVIGARADSWVQVLDANQNVLLTRMLRPGDRYMVPNRGDLVMLTGNAGGLIISVDGQPVPRIGSDGAILHNVRLDVDLLKAGRAVIQ